VTQDFDMLHIVPPQSAPEFIRTSPLAHETGWLDVNINTLQHNRYSNIFGHGDVAHLPTPKTAAAIYSQTPVLVQNILKELGETEVGAQYDGQSGCPIFTGDGKLMLCEFKYGRETSTTFYADQTAPAKKFYWMKKEIFPKIYWNLMPKGKWFGASNTFCKPSF